MLMRWVYPFILDKTKYWLSISFCEAQNILIISKSLVTIVYFSVFTCVYVVHMCMYFFACLCMHVEHALMCTCVCASVCNICCTSVCVHVEIWGCCWKLPWSLGRVHRVRVSQSTLGLADMTTFLTSLLWHPLFQSSEAGIAGRSPCLPGVYVGFWGSKLRSSLPAFDWYWDFVIVSDEDSILHKHVTVVFWRSACFWGRNGRAVDLGEKGS